MVNSFRKIAQGVTNTSSSVTGTTNTNFSSLYQSALSQAQATSDSVDYTTEAASDSSSATNATTWVSIGISALSVAPSLIASVKSLVGGSGSGTGTAAATVTTSDSLSALTSELSSEKKLSKKDESKLRDGIAKAQQEFDENAKNITQRKSQLANIESGDVGKVFKEEIAENKNIVSENLKEYKAANEAIDGFNIQLKNLEEQAGDLKGKAADVVKQRSNQEVVNNQNGEAVRVTGENVTKTEETVTYSQQEMAAIELDYRNATAAQPELEQKATSAESAYNENESAITTLESTISNNEVKSSNLQNKITSLQEKAKKKNDKQKDASSETSQISSLQSQKASLDKATEDAKAEKEEKVKKREELKKAKEDTAAARDENKANIETLGGALGKKKSEVDTNVSAYKNAVTNKATAEENMEAGLKALNQYVDVESTIKTQLDENAIKKADQEGAKNETTVGKAEIVANLDLAEDNEKVIYQTNSEAVQTRKAAVQTEISSLEKKNAALSKSIKSAADLLNNKCGAYSIAVDDKYLPTETAETKVTAKKEDPAVKKEDPAAFVHADDTDNVKVEAGKLGFKGDLNGVTAIEKKGDNFEITKGGKKITVDADGKEVTA